MIAYQGSGRWAIFGVIAVLLVLVMIFSMVSPLVEIAENTREIREDSSRITSYMSSISENSIKLKDHYSGSNQFRVKMVGDPVIPEKAIEKLTDLISTHVNENPKYKDSINIPPLEQQDSDEKTTQSSGLVW